MATEVWQELTNIQDEDVLRKMWQETEDFGRKKEIRARMYKLREQRLKDFYTGGETHSEVSVRKTKTHTESIGDQGSFMTMKSKEIRDSESPTRDISCIRRDQTWSGNFEQDKMLADNAGALQLRQTVTSSEPAVQVVESSVAAGRTSSQSVSESSSVQKSSVSSQSVVQSSKSQVQSNVQSSKSQVQSNVQGSAQIVSDQKAVTQAGAHDVSQSAVSESRVQQMTSGSQRVSSESRSVQGGQQTVSTSRTVKQSSSSTPGEIVTTTVTTYISSDPSKPPVEQTTVTVRKDDGAKGAENQIDQTRSGTVETRTVIQSEPKISKTVAESVSRSQRVHETRSSTSSSHTTQSVSTSAQQTSSSVQSKGQTVSQTTTLDQNQICGSTNDAVDFKQISNKSDVSQRHVVQDSSSVNVTENRNVKAIENVRDQNDRKSNQVEIVEVSSELNQSDKTVNNKKIDKADKKIQQTVKSTDAVDSHKSIESKVDRNRVTTSSKIQSEEAHSKSTTSATDQKILNEIQKLDTYLSTQPTPSNSVPMSPQSNIDVNWPVDKGFVYTDSSPKDNKVLVNGERATPVKHPSNLDLPKGATDGQYVTTYQHDYSPRVSRDHDINHQYFASTLRASPDRSSPSPSKRSSSKGSLDRSTPDRKFRGSPTRKTPDQQRRLSSSSYTIERISDNKRYSSDVTEKSQTLPKDFSKPKRKLSSTQTKAATKNRSSTPGTSPTISPTRTQRGRKPSLSDSDSDRSNATFNKTSQRKTDLNETKKYGSTTRIRGSTASVNVTDNESTRYLSSPSPTRHPARENTPDYSSEGSITRELRTSRNLEKSLSALDSSPERSAFSPIKSFRTSPERKDQTLNMINEERKHSTQTSSNVDISTSFIDNRSDRIGSSQTALSTLETRDTKTVESSPERSPNRSLRNVLSETIKSTNSVKDSRKNTTPTSSPDRKSKKDKPADKKPSGTVRPEPQKKVKTSSSPGRRSPTKPNKPSDTPIKSKPSSVSRLPDYSRPKTSTVVTDKTSVVRKSTTKSPGDDRITRRSSIPRAEIKHNSRPVREPDNKRRPSFTRDTTSSSTRVSVTKALSPVRQTKTSVTKSTISQTKDLKTVRKKPESPSVKKPTPTKPSYTPTKPTSQARPMSKTPLGPKKTTPVKNNETLTGRNKDTTQSTTLVRTTKNKAQETKVSTKAKKEISHTDSKEFVKHKTPEQLFDKESSDSIEDENPPEFFDEIDETDRVVIDRSKTDSTAFKLHEATTHTGVCDVHTRQKTVTEVKTSERVATDDSTKFINVEQSKKSSKTSQEFTPKTKTESSKAKKPKDSVKKGKKKKTGAPDESSSSEEETEVVIKYEDYSDIKETETSQAKVTKRDVSKDHLTTDKSKSATLKVIVQHPKSSRESSPEKSIPMSVTSDGGQTPRYADFIVEPEDVEVFDAKNLGPNRPIPSTLLDENRILEESEESTRENEKVSVAERVSKYIEKTNKIDIVTLDTERQQYDDDSDVFKTKELFESISRRQSEDGATLERRGSRKYSDANDFIENEINDLTRTEVTASVRSVDTVDKSETVSTRRSSVQQATPKTQKQVTVKQPSSEDVLKKTERRLSEHAPDIESKKAFFENRSKDISITETIKQAPAKEPFKSNSPFDQKVPHYMKETATATTRKESIQREFAPVRQGTETDIQLPNKEKRSSIDVDRLDTFIKSEAYNVCKDTKAPASQPTKDVFNRRKSSIEIQELDSFKKSEAYTVGKRSSVDMQKNVLNTSMTKESTIDTQQSKRKQSQSKSPEHSPSRKSSKDKSSERMPLMKKDTNIMTEERTSSETKTNKFGVALRRTSSSGAAAPKTSQVDSALTDNIPEIEEIFDLQLLEILLTRAVLYDERRRIRAQIRLVKKTIETEQSKQQVRKSTTTKNERNLKEETYQRKESSRIDKSSVVDRKRTPSPTKDADSKKPGYRSSPERSVRTSLVDRKVSSDKNNFVVESVRSYLSPDKRTSIKESKTESRRTSSSSPERKTTTVVETVTRKSTPYPALSTDRRVSSSYESRTESHSTYSRSSPERKVDPKKSDIFRSSPERKPSGATKSPERKSNQSPERKSSFETRKTSQTFRSSPERKISKEQDVKTYSYKTEERRSSDVRRSKTSPERKVSESTRKTSDARSFGRGSPERRVSSDVTESSRSSSQVFKTTTHYTTSTSSSVGRKGEDSITSSYGVGPTDDQGRPLFGLKALRSSNRTTDESSDVEVGEDVGDDFAEHVRGSDGRPLFGGLKALKSSITTTATSTTTTTEMPSTQHLVQKHQQFLSEVKSSEDKVRGEAPRARLRDSFILDSDEAAATLVASLPQPHGVSLKSIIQKHEDLATSGKNVRKEVQSTKTVTSSHGTISSDGKVSLTKHIVHGEMRGKDGAEPTGRMTSSQYSYRSDDPTQKPQISSTTTTTLLGPSKRNSISSLGEVRIEELKDNEQRRDSIVSSSTQRSSESRQREESKQVSGDQSSWQGDRKTIVRGDSIKALQNKFQQQTVSSSMKRVSGEEVRRSSIEERRSSIKEEEESRMSSKVSSTSVTSSTRRDSGSTLSSSKQTKETKSVTSFLDDTSKVTGVQDVLQRMRNADKVSERSDTNEDIEARSLLNKFLGASVILQGMEAAGAGPASSALVSQVERERERHSILTSSQQKTDDVDKITDEKQLQILLEACTDYEQRRKIRARLRKIMTERKGGQGELLGGDEGEERREEFSESRQFTSNDGGTFTKTEVHKTSTSSARLTKANSVQQSPFAKFRQLERQNSAPSGGALFKMTDPKLVRSASTIKDRLLCWARAQTSAYKNVQIDNFSTSWSNGLAFCALIHHFYPDAFDYDSLTPEARRHNFELAFRIAEEKGDIYPLLDVEDMVTMHKPDWKCVFTYVQSIYRRMHDQPNAVKSM